MFLNNFTFAVYSKDCAPPPDVRHGTPFDINVARYEAKVQRFFINTQISYQCLPGYAIRGNEILTCSSGCWIPAEPPVCHSLEDAYSKLLIAITTNLKIIYQ